MTNSHPKVSLTQLCSKSTARFQYLISLARAWHQDTSCNRCVVTVGVKRTIRPLPQTTTAEDVNEFCSPSNIEAHKLQSMRAEAKSSSHDLESLQLNPPSNLKQKDYSSKVVEMPCNPKPNLQQLRANLKFRLAKRCYTVG